MVLAMLALFVAILTGVTVLAFWLDTERAKHDRRSTTMGLAHAGLAVSGVIAWIAFVVGGNQPVGVTSLALLGATVLAGLATFLSTRARERRGIIEPALAVPAPVVAIHGAVATAAVAAAVLAFFV